MAPYPTCIYGTPYCYDSFDHKICSVPKELEDQAERILGEATIAGSFILTASTGDEALGILDRIIADYKGYGLTFSVDRLRFEDRGDDG